MVVRSVSWVAFAAVMVAVFVQVPGLMALSVTRMTPPWLGLMVPIFRVKLDGVKHPPLEVSVTTTPVAGAVPILP
jgi:hypothetical protein